MEEAQRKELGYGGWLKYTAMFVVVVVAFYILRNKLQDISWNDFVEGVKSIPKYKIVLAIAVTAVNFVVLTGYDMIAVRYLKKKLAVSKIMAGAIAGYSLSNIFGWILGGTAIRYRMYSNWGFKLFEIVALLTILSLTFWLGMFLLAGITFISLPVALPPEYEKIAVMDPHIWGWIFLGAVALYLLACIFIRQPVRWKKQAFALPPIQLSLAQLSVSAMEFLLAAAVLYVLLPHGLIQFSSVLVAYMVAMVAVVAVHAPGGIGVLEVIVLHLLVTEDSTPESKQIKVAVVSGLALYRVIYYLAPGLFGGLVYLMHEFRYRKAKLPTDDEETAAEVRVHAADLIAHPELPEHVAHQPESTLDDKRRESPPQ